MKFSLYAIDLLCADCRLTLTTHTTMISRTDLVLRVLTTHTTMISLTDLVLRVLTMCTDHMISRTDLVLRVLTMCTDHMISRTDHVLTTFIHTRLPMRSTLIHYPNTSDRHDCSTIAIHTTPKPGTCETQIVQSYIARGRG